MLDEIKLKIKVGPRPSNFQAFHIKDESLINFIALCKQILYVDSTVYLRFCDHSNYSIISSFITINKHKAN